MVSKKVKNKTRSSTKYSLNSSEKASRTRPTKKVTYFLEKGDTIAVVAPASSPSISVLADVKQWIEKNGFAAQIPDDLLKTETYLANTDKYRFNHLKTVISDPQVKAIWCLRGGYGCSRLIPELNKIKKQKEKIFIGLSDITTLHLFFTQKWNWRTLHAPVMSRLAEDQLSDQNEVELMQAILGEKIEFIFDGLKPLNASALKQKKITAPVVGGNLTVFSSNCGTGNDVISKKHILFLEDLNERGYRVDRMLQQIKQNKSFKNCVAIVLGDFLGGDEPLMLTCEMARQLIMFRQLLKTSRKI